MIQLLRTTGILLMVAGAVSILTWLIKPLRQIWPILAGPVWNWFLGLPLPLKIGGVAATCGFSLLVGSLLIERIQDRKKEKDLFDE